MFFGFNNYPDHFVYSPKTVFLFFILFLIQKSPEVVEEIDLVTPVKSATSRLIDAEKSEGLQNGGGDADRERERDNCDYRKENGNSKVPRVTVSTIPPGGYDSDESEESEGFTLG